MATGIEPITLPWKRPEKGVSAAELGASFRIEQRADGWHCTVRVGRRSEVLVTGMRRLRDAQCRAEAHAATMPVVARAVEERAAEAAKPAKEPPQAVQADAPSPADVVAPSAAKRRRRPTFQQVSDGCICGKIEGGTWIADPAGKVSVPAGTDPLLAQDICRVAAAHYTAQREKEKPEATPPTAAPPAARTVAKVSARTTARAAASKAATKSTSKAATSKAAAKSTSKAAASKAAAKSTSKAAASKANAGSTTKAAAKSTPRADATPEAKPTAKRAGRGKRRRGKAASKKAAGEPRRKGPRFVPQAFRGTNAPPGASPEALEALRTMQEEASPATKGKAAKTTQKEAAVGKKSSKAAAKGAACGCVTWTEAEGKARGEAKHGAFVIEPEGKKHALYFYDPDGQSRHVQSGDAAKLRSVAEEMAARGQPAPRAASAGDDAALLKMFMAGAMEEEL